MSKRFGRNQRRRARERIANLEQAMLMDRALLEHVSEHKRQLEREIENAKRIAGNMSALFEPGSLHVSGQARDRVFGRTMPEMPSDPNEICDAMARDIPLDVLLTKVDRDKLSMAIHCNVMFSDHTLRYAVSEDAWRHMPEDILVDRVADALSRQLGRDLAQPKPDHWRSL